MPPIKNIWTDKITAKLINLVQETPALWDSQESGNGDRDEAWNRIAASLGSGITGAMAKNRFTRMKSTFVLNFKKAQSLQNVAGTSEYIPTWKLYNKLQFLTPALPSITPKINQQVTEVSQPILRGTHTISPISQSSILESYHSGGPDSQEVQLFFDPHQPLCSKTPLDSEETPALHHFPHDEASAPSTSTSTSNQLPSEVRTLSKTASPRQSASSFSSLVQNNGMIIDDVRASSNTKAVSTSKTDVAKQETLESQKPCSLKPFTDYVYARLQEMNESERKRARREIVEALEK